MVIVDFVGKCLSLLGLNSLLENTQASGVKLEKACKSTGLFGFEELKEPKDIDFYLKESIRKVEIIVEEIKNKNHKCNLALACDELLDTLYEVRNSASVVMLTHPKKKFVDIAEEVYWNAYVCIEKLFANREYYYNFKKAAKEKHDILEREPIDEYFINRFLRAFERGIILFDERKKKRIFKLKRQLLQVSRKKKWWKKLFVVRENEWYAILHKRLELAYLYGYSTYANYILLGSIAGKPDFVLKFLKNLRENIKPLVDIDLREIMQGNEFRYTKSELSYQDVSHLISLSQKKILDINSCIKDYFSLDTCLDGLKLVLRSLFNIILEDEDIINGEIWHGDVKKYCVREENEILGYIYIDVFRRPNKSVGTFLIRSGRMCKNGTYQRPMAVISLFVSNPAISQPSLLNVYDVDDLFYAMGRAMHYILGQKKYVFIGGTRCPNDLIDVSCNLMKCFASDYRVLKKFAKHYQTKEVIPDDLTEKLFKYKNKFSAYATQWRVFDATFDQACHSRQFLKSSYSEIFGTVWDEHFGSCMKPTIGIEYRYADRNYIFKGLNYANLMSRAIALLIWQKYFKDDPLNQVAGKQYRKEILSETNLKPARCLVEKYLQVKLTPKLLAEALLNNPLT